MKVKDESKNKVLKKFLPENGTSRLLTDEECDVCYLEKGIQIYNSLYLYDKIQFLRSSDPFLNFDKTKKKEIVEKLIDYWKSLD